MYARRKERREVKRKGQGYKTILLPSEVVSLLKRLLFFVVFLSLLVSLSLVRRFNCKDRIRVRFRVYDNAISYEPGISKCFAQRLAHGCPSVCTINVSIYRRATSSARRRTNERTNERQLGDVSQLTHVYGLASTSEHGVMPCTAIGVATRISQLFLRILLVFFPSFINHE